MKTEIKISNKEIERYLGATASEYPKYATQVMNLANQNAQGTRPKVVGQMSELIQLFPGSTLEEWKEWYLNGHPQAIDEATDKVYEMVQKIMDATRHIDRDMVRKWVEDLVIVNTFSGLKFQSAILTTISEKKKCSYKFATPEEESHGIDGYLNDIPVSIKPISYTAKQAIPEQIQVEIIYYEKLKDGIKVTYDF